MLKAPLVAAGIVAATALGAATPANAQAVTGPMVVQHRGDVINVTHRGRHYQHVLPKRIVVRSLYRRGYRDVHRVHFRNGYWRARAYGRRGLIALTIHPRSGQIVHRRVVRRYHPAPYRYGHHGGRGSLTFSFGIR